MSRTAAVCPARHIVELLRQILVQRVLDEIDAGKTAAQRVDLGLVLRFLHEPGDFGRSHADQFAVLLVAEQGTTSRTNASDDVFVCFVAAGPFALIGRRTVGR